MSSRSLVFKISLPLLVMLGISFEAFGNNILQCVRALGAKETEVESNLLEIAKAHAHSPIEISVLRRLNFLIRQRVSLDEEQVVELMEKHEFLRGYAPLAPLLGNWNLATMPSRGSHSLQGSLRTLRGEEVIIFFEGASRNSTTLRKDSIEIRSAYGEDSEDFGYSDLRRFLAAGLLVSRAHGGLGWVSLGVHHILSIDSSPLVQILPGPFLAEVLNKYSSDSEELASATMPITKGEMEKLLSLLLVNGSVAKEIAERIPGSSSMRTKLEGFLRGDADSRASSGFRFALRIQE